MTEQSSRGHLRIYRDVDFLTSDKIVDSFYMEIPCEVEGDQVVVPSFELPGVFGDDAESERLVDEILQDGPLWDGNEGH